MTRRKGLEQILGSDLTVRSLFAANVLVAFVIVWISRDTVLGDSPSYVSLAHGILHGRYTQWWPLETYIPDTWRTPGFPLYIACFIWLFGSEQAVIWFQFLLYAGSIHLTLRMIERFDRRPAVKSIFLLFLIPLVNVPFYIGQIYPEIPVLAAITGALYISTRPGGMGFGRAIVLGALYGFIFQCRPVFLLFPPLMAFLQWIDRKHVFRMKEQLVVLFVFVATLVPYGLWNQKNHGVFKITPLEGGGGMVHFGYWAGKIPAYTETVYWRNFTGDEVITFVDEDSIPHYIETYEQEWAWVKAELEPFLTVQDSIMLASRPLLDHPVSNTFNTEYTLERERLLIGLTTENIKNDLGYFIRYKIYSAFRLWIIGVQRGDFMRANTIGRLKMLFPTVVTGLLFVLAAVLIPVAYWKRRLSFNQTYPLLVYLFYFWLIHIPFVIQARYTTPVRFAMLMLLALAIMALWRGRTQIASVTSTLTDDVTR